MRSLDELNDVLRRRLGSKFLGCRIEERQAEAGRYPALVCYIDVDADVEPLLRELVARMNEIESEYGKALDIVVERK